MKALTVANKSLGIDIGTYSVKAVVLSRSIGGICIEKCLEAKIEREEEARAEPEKIVAALNEIVQKIRIGRAIVVTGVSTHLTAVRNLQLPFSDETKARQVLKFQTESHLPFPIEEVVVDFYDTKTGNETNMNALVTAIHKNVVSDHLEIVHQAELEPEVIDIDFMSIYSAVKKIQADFTNEGTILIDIGAAKTIMSYVKAKKMLAVRSIPFAGDAFTQAIAKELNISFKDAEVLKIEKGDATGSDEDPETGQIARAIDSVLTKFNRELNRTLLYFSSQLKESSFSKIILTGGSAKLKSIDKFFSNALSAPVITLSGIDEIKNRSGIEFLSSDFATSIGLALRGIGESETLQDFRQEELAYPFRYRRVRKYFYIAAFFLIGIIAVSIFGFFTRLHIKEQEAFDLKMKTQGVIWSLFDPKKYDVKTVAEMEKRLVELRREVEDLRGVNPIPVLEILRKLSLPENIPEEMKIMVTKFWLSRERLQLDGTVESFDDVNKLEQLFKGLEFSKLFEDVKRGPSTRTGNRIKFSFTLKLKPKY